MIESEDFKSTLFTDFDRPISILPKSRSPIRIVRHNHTGRRHLSPRFTPVSLEPPRGAKGVNSWRWNRIWVISYGNQVAQANGIVAIDANSDSVWKWHFKVISTVDKYDIIDRIGIRHCITKHGLLMLNREMVISHGNHTVIMKVIY